MAKQRHDEPQPGASRNALIILSLGGILVAALVVWALTRTVDPTTLDQLGTVAPDTVATSTFTPTSTPTTTAPTATAEMVGDRASVKRIAAEDLRDQLRANAVTVLDVRDAASFSTGHIPGSIHMPFASVEGMMSTLPKDKPIVTYCT